MEMQRRREREPKAESSEHPLHESLVATARYNLPLVGTRVIERIRGRLKYVIHHARPPEAMVRYFGSEQGSGAEDESGPVDSAGVNFQRDRLLLEAVRHVPTFLPPDVPVWFVTGDAKLAAQADCEGFRVGFSWKPTQPSRFVVTSPHIDPYTLLPHFVPWQEVVEEIRQRMLARPLPSIQTWIPMFGCAATEVRMIGIIGRSDL